MATSVFIGPSVGAGATTPAGWSWTTSALTGPSNSTLAVDTVEADSATFAGVTVTGATATTLELGNSELTLLNAIPFENVPLIIQKSIPDAQFTGDDHAAGVFSIGVNPQTNLGNQVTAGIFASIFVDPTSTHKATDDLIAVWAQVDGPTADQARINGWYSTTYTNGNITDTAFGMQPLVLLEGGTGKTVAAARGIYTYIQNDGDNAVTDGASILVYPVYNPGTGTVTLSAGVHVGSNGAPTGTITTGYGLLIDDQVGTATTAYNLYSGGATALNVIEGELRVVSQKCPSGQTAPLSITDTGKIVKGSCS